MQNSQSPYAYIESLLNSLYPTLMTSAGDANLGYSERGITLPFKSRLLFIALLIWLRNSWAGTINQLVCVESRELVFSIYGHVYWTQRAN